MKFFFLFFSTFLLISCGKESSKTPMNLQSSQVINGERLAQESILERSIVKLRAHTYAFTMRGDMRVIKSYCTGTFIGPKTLITAAHCLHMKTFLNGYQRVDQIYLDQKNLAPESIHIHPQYNIEDDFRAPYDVAVLQFKNNQSPSSYPVRNEGLKFNEKIRIYGFGNERGTSASEFKTFGENVISPRNVFEILSVDPEKIEQAKRLLPQHGLDKMSLSYIGTRVYGDSRFPLGLSVSSEKGDSGGPIIVDNQLAGVISGGVNLKYPRDSRLNFGVDLNQDHIKEFLSPFFGPN